LNVSPPRISLSSDPVLSAPSLEATDLELPGRIALDRFSLTPGKCVVVCGPNGSGKSSLLRLLGGLENGYVGRISLGDADMKNLSRREIAKHIAWLPQRAQLAHAITCLDVVASARYRFAEPRKSAHKYALAALEAQGIAHLATRRADHISGGELQRVLIASLIAQDVSYLLVDEPANHLDPGHQVATYERLGELWRSGKGVVVVSHDVRLARLLGPPEEVQIVCVNQHKIVSKTHLADAQLPDRLEELYGVEFMAQEEASALAVKLP